MVNWGIVLSHTHNNKKNRRREIRDFKQKKGGTVCAMIYVKIWA